MVDQDIPFLDDTITQLPPDIRADLAERGRNDLFFFNKGILGFRDMTSSCHGPLCAYIDLNSKQFKMMLMPRDHLKTSSITIGGTLQKVVKDPETRANITNESGTNAQRFLRAIRQSAEGNRVFRALYSGMIPKDAKKVRWNDSELDFNRQGHYPEPTIDAIGMTGAVTSRHYTHMTFDDPISEEAVKSEKVMQDAITRMSGALSLLVNPETDTIWLVGTRWALHDVYSEWRKLFGSKLGIFGRSATEEDQPIWPERFSLETLALKRRLLGEYRYSCLMMNNPRNAELQDLNIEDARFWEWDGDDQVKMFDKSGLVFRTVLLSEMDIITTCDLSAAELLRSDRNAITTVGITPWNEAVVLDSWAKRCDALEVIKYLFELKKRFSPRVFGIEDIGYQKTLQTFIRAEANRRMEYLNVQPFKGGYASGAKIRRIRGLQPYLATGRLYIKADQHILRDEMSEFPLGQHDDALDSLAMQPQFWIGQMSPEARTKYQKSEDELIRKLRRGQSMPAPSILNSKGIPFDFEEPDEFERQQNPIYGYTSL